MSNVKMIMNEMRNHRINFLLITFLVLKIVDG